MSDDLKINEDLGNKTRILLESAAVAKCPVGFGLIAATLVICTQALVKALRQRT